MSVVIGADPAPETYPNEVEHRALIARHSRSVGEAVKSMIETVWVGVITTAANTTATLVDIPEVKASDLVFVQPFITNGVPIADTFAMNAFGFPLNAQLILSHSSDTASHKFNVMVIRP